MVPAGSLCKTRKERWACDSEHQCVASHVNCVDCLRFSIVGTMCKSISDYMRSMDVKSKHNQDFVARPPVVRD